MNVNKISTSKIMVTRIYKEAKFKRNITAAAAAMNLAIGVNDAI